MPEPRRRRATRLDVKLAREASQAVRSIRSKVNDWQKRAAYLNAIAGRRVASGEPVDAILNEANTLAREIELYQRLLAEQAAALPEPVRNHSRFQDIVRAVTTASAMVHRVGQATPANGTPELFS